MIEPTYVVVITGAAGGLGKALCAQLQARCVTLVALDRDQEALKQLEQDSQYPKLHIHALDICDELAIEHCFQMIERRYGRIDVLINNAGITQISSVDQLSSAVLDHVMQVNFRGAALVAMAATQLLRQSAGSHVVLSSVAGFAPLVKRSAYCASKHALVGFYTSLRAEERKHGVHVLIVSPSFISSNVGRFKPQQQIQRPGAATDAIDQISPAQAAHQILQALDKRKENLYLGRVAKLSAFLQRLSPRLYEHMMQRSIKV